MYRYTAFAQHAAYETDSKVYNISAPGVQWLELVGVKSEKEKRRFFNTLVQMELVFDGRVELTLTPGLHSLTPGGCQIGSYEVYEEALGRWRWLPCSLPDGAGLDWYTWTHTGLSSMNRVDDCKKNASERKWYPTLPAVRTLHREMDHFQLFDFELSVMYNLASRGGRIEMLVNVKVGVVTLLPGGVRLVTWGIIECVL